MENSKKLSLAIPTYEFNGRGAEVLEYIFNQLNQQVFQNFDIVISDDSKDNNILNLCNKWESSLNIKYYKNTIRGASSNFNNAISKCTGEIIKFLCGDDYLFNEYSLKKIVSAFDKNTNWLASAYWHTKNKEDYFNFHLPSINPNIFVINTIGSPSCIAFRNMRNIPLFDPNLTYYYDCEWYYRIMKLHGCPKFLNEPTIVNYLWENSITSIVTDELQKKEVEYILNKYKFELEDRNENRNRNKNKNKE
jgi:glycosyltransferase involved in cell wall biosynthesis